MTPLLQLANPPAPSTARRGGASAGAAAGAGASLQVARLKFLLQNGADANAQAPAELLGATAALLFARQGKHSCFVAV
jgi:hypothetical protein